MNLIYLLHFCLCLVMLGVIWVIQIVHYPSFRFAKLGPFRDFTSFHVKAISSIVIPLMTIELLSGSFLAYKSPRPLILLNFTLILLTWLSTFILSVPLHNKLSQDFDLKNIEKLVLTNWPRTLMWTIRSVILISLFYEFEG
ncbi:MAG: hypothetical protein CME63_16180 [Halobacteriovoraceae bacterium]|nr:hypothetical protein [Halobacteriovoraceae bacterium]MBC99282.1 hypothetical protein [Halobacteriovoraceae bacterium]